MGSACASHVGGWLCRHLKSGSKTAALHNLQGAEEFVEFVGGVEIGFQFAGV